MEKRKKEPKVRSAPGSRPCGDGYAVNADESCDIRIQTLRYTSFDFEAELDGIREDSEPKR